MPPVAVKPTVAAAASGSSTTSSSRSTVMPTRRGGPWRCHRRAPRTPARSAARAGAGGRTARRTRRRSGPGRGDITSTRVLMNTASLIEWVMNSPAKPSAWNSSQRLVVEVLPGDLVDGAERLVEQEQRRLERQRAGERAAHLHAAREGVRVVPLEPAQADHLDRGLGEGGPLGAVDAAELGQQLDVLADGPPRQQGGVLEHVAEVVAVDRHRAGGGRRAALTRSAAGSTCRSRRDRRSSRTRRAGHRRTRRRGRACRRGTSSRCGRT